MKTFELEGIAYVILSPCPSKANFSGEQARSHAHHTQARSGIASTCRADLPKWDPGCLTPHLQLCTQYVLSHSLLVLSHTDRVGGYLHDIVEYLPRRSTINAVKLYTIPPSTPYVLQPVLSTRRVNKTTTTTIIIIIHPLHHSTYHQAWHFRNTRSQPLRLSLTQTPLLFYPTQTQGLPSSIPYYPSLRLHSNKILSPPDS